MIEAELHDIFKTDPADPVSSQTMGLAMAIITHVSTALVNFEPGGITGTVPSSGGPLTEGAGADGVLLGLNGSALATLMAANMGFPSATPELQSLANAIVAGIGESKASLEASDIIAVCSNSPTSPGVLVGTALGGAIEGIDVSEMESVANSEFGSISDKLNAVFTVVKTRIESDAIMTFASVVGVCLAGGGELEQGAALGGIISGLT